MFSHFKSLLQLIRLHQPAGFLLLFWPCAWGVILASGSSSINYFLIFLFLIGSMAVRGAGCIINDIADREIDAQVERTKNRPLASGALTVRTAILMLILMLAIGLYVFLQLNNLGKILSIAAFGVSVFYPFTKRFFKLPQLVLGIAFNSGVLIAYATIKNEVSLAAILLYLGGICWTLAYDTIYANQDKKYDEKIGLNSTALLFGKYNKLIIAAFFDATYSFAFIACALEFGFKWWKIALFIPIIVDFYRQILTLNLDDPKDCMAKFKQNAYISGIIIFFTILIYGIS